MKHVRRATRVDDRLAQGRAPLAASLAADANEQTAVAAVAAISTAVASLVALLLLRRTLNRAGAGGSTDGTAASSNRRISISSDAQQNSSVVSPVETAYAETKATLHAVAIAPEYGPAASGNLPALLMPLAGAQKDAVRVERALRRAAQRRRVALSLTSLRGGPVGAQRAREAITAALEAAVRGSRSGDTAFIFFSGHGTHALDLDGDESQRKGVGNSVGAGDPDEVLVLVGSDATAEYITDDWLTAECTRAAQRGAAVTVVVDACHSGGMLDVAPSPSGQRARRAGQRTTRPSRGRWKHAADVTSARSSRQGGLCFLASSSEDELAYETTDGSVFGALVARAIASVPNRRERSSVTVNHLCEVIAAQREEQRKDHLGRASSASGSGVAGSLSNFVMYGRAEQRLLA